MGAFTMRLLRLFLPLMILGVCHAGWAQSPTYGLGKTPTEEEIRAWDISISPTGKELPPGQRNAPRKARKSIRRNARHATGQPDQAGLAPMLIKPQNRCG